MQTSAVQNSAEPANAEAFPARLDSPAPLPDQPEPPMYVPGPLCSEPLMHKSAYKQLSTSATVLSAYMEPLTSRARLCAGAAYAPGRLYAGPLTH